MSLARRSPRTWSIAALAVCAFGACNSPSIRPSRRFDVREFGASGRRSDDAHAALQAAIDACANSGGGEVYIPPGDYTSGSLELRSRVRLFIEAGATIHSAKGKAAFAHDALLFGEDLDGVSIEGRGRIDGHAEYVWRENDLQDDYLRANLEAATAAGKSLRRSFPTPDSVGHLVQLVRCRDVELSGLSFANSPSWTINLWGCERVVIDALDVRTSLKDGVWADGIDPDGCRDVRISNSTIETGDDALVFYSSSAFGPARPCEDITVTNCRLSSSSSAIKFCDGNQNCVRRVTISNCAITNSNRGLAFMVFDGGYVSDVVVENLTIECRRRDWFWWGEGDPIYFAVKRRCEISPQLDASKEPPAGSIRNVRIQNVVARGAGTSSIEGHATSPLENVTIDGLDLHLTSDPSAPYERTTAALRIVNARDCALRNTRIEWEPPNAPSWTAAVEASRVERLVLEHLAVRQAGADSTQPAILLQRFDGVTIRDSLALEGTHDFVRAELAPTRNLCLIGNDLRAARRAVASDELAPLDLRLHDNLEREP